MSTRTCARCKQKFPTETFRLKLCRRNGRYYPDSYCGRCNSEKKKEWGEANKERKKTYMKKYREDNRETIKKQRSEYEIAHVSERAAKYQAEKLANPEKFIEASRKYHREHRELRREYGRQYGRLHKEERAAKFKDWLRRNPDRWAYLCTRRHERSRALPCTLTADEWTETLFYFGYKCVYCGLEVEMLCRDHFVPVVKGGGFTKDNIVPACRHCNSSKRTSDAEWWLKKNYKDGEYRFSAIINYLGGCTQEIQ